MWTPAIPQIEQYNVYAWWRAASDRATNVPFTIVHSGGSTTVTVNQTVNGSQWNLLGTFTMSPGQNHRIMLTDQANGLLIADAVQVTRVGAPLPMAIFAPALAARDRYQVYARWYYYPDYADNAPFVVHHEDGSATVRMDQSASGLSKKGNLVGTYTLGSGQNHRVELQDDANGTYVIADAVRFVPVAEPKVASWEIPGSLIPQTGSYNVYAKWPASSQNATNAPYTVSHAGGSATVTVNQRVNGGQWNLLGSFTFNGGGTGYKVELSDGGAAGTVAADAIYIVPAGAPSSDAFVWTPAIPSSGMYQVYARWPAASANAGAAQYTVTHAGGTANVTLNQKQNGGSWVPLGSWSFAPGAGHKVTLAAAAEGTTIADALLFVGAGAQPANLLYVHPDHLGSPQKLTDASQAVVWDGVFDPFGKDVAVTGLATMQMRFPGQYADEETGYSYNYSRDYEPSLGRYLQSDPIGLRGGINVYVYVLSNPIYFTDPLGLKTTVKVRCGRVGSIHGGFMGYVHCEVVTTCDATGETRNYGVGGGGEGIWDRLFGGKDPPEYSEKVTPNTPDGMRDYTASCGDEGECECDIGDCIRKTHAKGALLAYYARSMNSNTYAHFLLTTCGCSVARPEGAIGWETQP